MVDETSDEGEYGPVDHERERELARVHITVLGFGGSSSSNKAQIRLKIFLPSKPARSPLTMLIGVNRILDNAHLQFRLGPVRLAAQRKEWLFVLWLAGLYLPAALDLGVQLGAEQDHQVGDPEPHEEHDHRGQRTVRLVV